MAIPTGTLSRRARCQDVPGAASRNSESNSSGVRPRLSSGQSSVPACVDRSKSRHGGEKGGCSTSNSSELLAGSPSIAQCKVISCAMCRKPCREKGAISGRSAAVEKDWQTFTPRSRSQPQPDRTSVSASSTLSARGGQARPSAPTIDCTKITPRIMPSSSRAMNTPEGSQDCSETVFPTGNRKPQRR